MVGNQSKSLWLCKRYESVTNTLNFMQKSLGTYDIFLSVHTIHKDHENQDI